MSDGDPREVLRLRADTTVETDARGEVTLRSPHSSLSLGRPGPGLRAVIERLASTGGTARELLELHRTAATGEKPTEAIALVQRLARAGRIARCLEHRGKLLLVAHAPDASRGQWAAALEPDAVLQLSRFASIRREGERMVLESPLASARIELHDRRVTALLHDLARPTPAAVVIGRSKLPPLLVDAVLGVLVMGGLVSRVGAGGLLPEDAEPGPGMWDPIELAAHHRTRHEQPGEAPVGKTFPFVGRFEPLPVVAPPRGSERVELPRPDLVALARRDPPLCNAMEARRSQRRQGDVPLGVEALGELLFRTLRVRAVLPSTEADRQGRSDRPYPSAGACHPLETYVAVARCRGLERGLWHYHPQQHALYRVDVTPESVEALLDDAMQASGAAAPPQILLVLSARFGRTAWVYGRLTRRFVLQEVGVVFQSVYLVATAMGLAACALGRGSSTRFARLSGLDPRVEASVGEIMLGSAPDPGA